MRSTEPLDTEPAEPLVQTIVSQVAEIAGRTPGDLPPLYEAIDPDALEALVDSAPDSTVVSFTYHGCAVTVTGGRTVRVVLESDEKSF
jgi:hypothetical protein